MLNIQDVFNNLEEFNISITNLSLANEIKNCSSQEQLDRILDALYIGKWLSCDSEYKIDSVKNGVNIYYIGNGLYGYMKDNKRFESMEEAEEE